MIKIEDCRETWKLVELLKFLVYVIENFVPVIYTWLSNSSIISMTNTSSVVCNRFL
jgi:hypothetical protein